MRIATFNIENLDDKELSEDEKKWNPTFDERLKVLRPSLNRLRADVICFQEVHGQDVANQPRQLRALKTLLDGTRYSAHKLATTTLKGKPDVEAKRNLVTAIPPNWSFLETREVKHEFTPPPLYKAVTASGDPDAKKITWERPLLYTHVEAPSGTKFHILNAHFKSKNPTNIPGQNPISYKWKSAAGWAEGFFISSMKRVGAALEARVFLDTIFANEPDAKIVLCGDLNAETGEVPLAALFGRVEDTGNSDLLNGVMYAAESSVPEEARFTLYHQGKKNMLDHLLISRSMIGHYKGTEIQNEMLSDESVKYASDKKFPGSDHAAVVAEFSDSIFENASVS